MKKKDAILIGALLLLALISWAGIRLYRGNKVMRVPTGQQVQGGEDAEEQAHEQESQKAEEVTTRRVEETTRRVEETTQETTLEVAQDTTGEAAIWEQNLEKDAREEAAQSPEETQESLEEEATEIEGQTEGMPAGGVYGIHILAMGEDLGVYPLTEDRVIEIGETNTVEIKDGAANMVHAMCPDQLCVHMGSIVDNYGLIVCLPNEVIVEGVTLVPAENEVVLDGIS